jgi:hypothetical protein
LKPIDPGSRPANGRDVSLFNVANASALRVVLSAL